MPPSGASEEGPAAARWADRLLALLLASPAAGVLGVAVQLHPDPAGMGTHRQLGLGTCTFLRYTGWPCPTCGMTTAFAYAAHGKVLAALRAQPFGFVLFLITAGVVVVSAAELIRPAARWRRVWRALDRWEGPVAGALFAGLVLGWLYKLLQFHLSVSGGAP